MAKTKRILVALVFGLFAGLFCYLGALWMGLIQNYEALRITNIFVNRALIGFVIGISALRMKWYSHGLLMGQVVGLPFLIFDMIAGYEPMIWFGVIIANGIFGVMIEFFTTKVFNLPAGGE